MTFSNEIVAGNVLVREAIQSENYAAGSAGWKIAANGDAEFNDVTVRGELIAGTATDYVKVTPSPVPAIEWATSSGNVVAPARVGYASLGNDEWVVTGPQYTAHGPSSISFSDDFLVVSGSRNLTLEALTGTARLNGPDVRIGSNANYVQVEPNDRKFKTFGRDRGRGIEDFTALTVSTGAAAGEQVVITSGIVDFEQDRAYRITYHYQGQGNTAGDGIGFRMKRTGLGGTSLWDSLATHEVRAINSIVNGESSVRVYNNTGALLSTVIVGTVYRQSGAGNVLGFANPANPVWLEIEDIGDVADYPGIKAL